MNVKATLKTIGAVIYKNRATIETVAGMAAVAVGTGIIISKAKQAAEISYEIEEMLDDIHEKDATRSWEDKKDRSRARKAVLKFAVVNYSKAYGVGGGLVVFGEVLQGVGFGTKCGELQIATASLSALSATFAQYRQRVIDDQGEEKDQEYLLGPQIVKAEVKPDGTVTQITETIPDHNKDLGLPPHCIMFDEANPNWEKDPLVNRDYLEQQQIWLNERLNREGFLWENDIRRAIGAELVKCGWTSGILAENPDGGPNKLYFGLDAKNPAAQRFRDGVEPSIILQLNVEDNITDKLKLRLI